MVIAWLPDPARRLADARRYVPAGVPVVKSVAAVTGDTVCAAGDGLRINGRSAARRLTQDARGRALPRWGGCRALEEDQILLLAPRPDSFDGRYFGPSSRRQLIGTARLIWSW
jgi:type IV secretory pathway protease TraF